MARCEFKVGDIVKCIRGSVSQPDKLQAGVEYVVHGVTVFTDTEAYVSVVFGEVPEDGGWDSMRFVLVKESKPDYSFFWETIGKL